VVRLFVFVPWKQGYRRPAYRRKVGGAYDVFVSGRDLERTGSGRKLVLDSRPPRATGEAAVQRRKPDSQRRGAAIRNGELSGLQIIKEKTVRNLEILELGAAK
jgi:hypothetical protein